MLKIWEPPLYLTAKTLYDAITITKPTFAIPAMKKTRTRLRQRTRVADTVAEQQIDTAAAAASEFFALPVLRVDLCGLATARQQSVARDSSRHVW